MKKFIICIIIVSGFLFNGCATWSTSNVKRTEYSNNLNAAKISEKEPNKIIISNTDISDHKYKVLGDIEVTVNKTTIFHEDPKQENVNEKLRKEAAKLGADAVILVRYGTVGVSFMSWGALNGKGRAVVFLD